MRYSGVFLPLLVTGLVLASAHQAYADTSQQPIIVNVDNSGLQGAFTEGYKNMVSAYNSGVDTLKGSVDGFRDNLVGQFKNPVKDAVKSFNSGMLGLAQFLLSTNPDVDSMQGLWQSVVTVISCFYLLVLTIIGLKFLASGHSAQGREMAKSWLKNALLMMAGVSVSFALYKLLLDTATAIVQFVWATGFESLFSGYTTSGSGLILLSVTSLAVSLALITLFARYVFLLLAAPLFPIGIFLYYTPKLQNWGKIVFNLIGTALFMQFMDAVILVASSQVMQGLAGQAGQSFIPALSFALIALINILMACYAALKSALSITDNSPTLGASLGALAGQISLLVKAIATQKTSQEQGALH